MPSLKTMAFIYLNLYYNFDNLFNYVRIFVIQDTYYQSYRFEIQDRSLAGWGPKYLDR